MSGKSAIAALFIVALFTGCAHSPETVSGASQNRTPAPAIVEDSAAPAATSRVRPTGEDDPSRRADVFAQDYVDDDDIYDDDFHQDERVAIADPLEPFNRAMNTFNDRMYFWVLKPVALGYSAAVPEPARISAKNFFDNLGFPARFLSCLLQTDFSGAATEAGRFAVNTLWGIGGLLDPAGSEKLNWQKQDVDLGQTLGVYGVGHGFYIVWPVYGPSSPRDTLTNIGDHFLYPPSYIEPWYAWFGLWSYEKVNAASLRIGEYEALKGAAIDPYVAIRDGYIQYRAKSVKTRKEKSLLFRGASGDPSKE